MRRSRVCFITAIIGLAVMFPASATAQARGDTQQTTHHAEFNNVFTGKFDPTPRVGGLTRETFTSQIKCTGGSCSADLGPRIGFAFLQQTVQGLFGVSIPGFVFDVISFLGGIQTSLVFGPRGDIRGYFEVSSVTEGRMSLMTPTDFTLTYPAPNSFACGDPITLDSAASVFNAASMQVTPPYHEIELGVGVDKIRLEASLDFCTPEICLLPKPPPLKGCIPGFSFPKWCLHDVVNINFPTPSISSPDVPLITVCEEAFKPGADRFDVAACALGNQIFGIGGLLITVSNSGETMVGFGNALPNTPEVEAVYLNSHPVALALNKSEANRTLRLSGTKADTVDLDLDFISLADYFFCPACPFGVMPTRLDIPGLGAVDLGDLTLTYRADHGMSFTSRSSFRDHLALAVPMAFQETLDNGSPTGASGTGSAFIINADNRVVLQFPQHLSSPVAVTPTYHRDFSLATLTEQRYATAQEFRLAQVTFPLVTPPIDETLFNKTLSKTPVGSPKTVENYTINITSAPGSGSPRSAIVLDPENPIITISDHAIQDVINLGGGERAVVYRTKVRNDGDVPLSDVEVHLDLAATFPLPAEFEVMCLTSPDLVINMDYDGDIVTNLLAPLNVLVVAQESTIEVLVRVVPEISPIVEDGCFGTVEYSAFAKAFGVSPIGTFVENNFNQCTETITGEDIVATVDLGAAVIDAIDDYAIYGSTATDINGDFNLSRGNAGSGRELNFRPLTNASSVDPRIIGDAHAGRNVHVSQSRITLDYLQIGNRLFLNDSFSSLDLTGAISEASDCAAVFPVPTLDIPKVNRLAPAIILEPGESALAGPGEYSLIELHEGSELTLSAGEYLVDRLSIFGDWTTLIMNVASGPVTLNLHKWVMDEVENVGFLVDGGSPRDAFINYDGNAAQVFIGALVQGNITAPNAAIDFREGSLLQGKAHAKRVLIGANTSFSDHKFQEELIIDQICRDAIVRP